VQLSVLFLILDFSLLCLLYSLLNGINISMTFMAVFVHCKFNFNRRELIDTREKINEVNTQDDHYKCREKRRTKKLWMS
jgi:hypothetical protein